MPPKQAVPSVKELQDKIKELENARKEADQKAKQQATENKKKFSDLATAAKKAEVEAKKAEAEAKKLKDEATKAAEANRKQIPPPHPLTVPLSTVKVTDADGNVKTLPFLNPAQWEAIMRLGATASEQGSAIARLTTNSKEAETAQIPRSRIALKKRQPKAAKVKDVDTDHEVDLTINNVPVNDRKRQELVNRIKESILGASVNNEVTVSFGPNWTDVRVLQADEASRSANEIGKLRHGKQELYLEIGTEVVRIRIFEDLDESKGQRYIHIVAHSITDHIFDFLSLNEALFDSAELLHHLVNMLCKHRDSAHLERGYLLRAAQYLDVLVVRPLCERDAPASVRNGTFLKDCFVENAKGYDFQESAALWPTFRNVLSSLIAVGTTLRHEADNTPTSVYGVWDTPAGITGNTDKKSQFDACFKARVPIVLSILKGKGLDTAASDAFLATFLKSGGAEHTAASAEVKASIDAVAEMQALVNYVYPSASAKAAAEAQVAADVAAAAAHKQAEEERARVERERAALNKERANLDRRRTEINRERDRVNTMKFNNSASPVRNQNNRSNSRSKSGSGGAVRAQSGSNDRRTNSKSPAPRGYTWGKWHSESLEPIVKKVQAQVLPEDEVVGMLNGVRWLGLLNKNKKDELLSDLMHAMPHNNNESGARRGRGN